MMDRPINAGYWAVLRHGLRATDMWRVAYRSRAELAARERYARISSGLRQGIAELVDPHGRVAARTGAPRLRTRG